MPALAHDLLLEAGATYSEPFQAVDAAGDPFEFPVDSTARWQIRAAVDSSTVLLEGTPTIGPGSTFEVEIAAVDTAALPARGVWGLEITAPGGEPVYRVLQGKVKVSPQVVR